MISLQFAIFYFTNFSYTGDLEADWIDELNEDDDSAADDSDDEGLNSKLCTFTQTQKEFMNQHWYHCHTCKMVDGVGVCTVCAKVSSTFSYLYSKGLLYHEIFFKKLYHADYKLQ